MDRKDIGSGVIGAILSALLVVTLLPAMGIQFAFADQPAPDAEASSDAATSATAKARPEVTGGTLALTASAAEAAAAGEAATSAAAVATSAGAADADAEAPVAHEREDGMLVADGLVYTVTDGGLALVGFDAASAAAQDVAPEDAAAEGEGAAAEGAAAPDAAAEGDGAEAASDAADQVAAVGPKLVVPARVVVDGKEVPVVAVDIADGQVADAVTVLALPQDIKDIKVERLASAFPHLASVEVASAASSSLPVAAGAASIRATYSSSGGMLFRSTTVEAQAVGSHRADLASATGDEADVTTETVECKELVWAPPALVAARIPVECRSIAEGAFADVRDLQTVVCFSTMERIAEGAFTAAQKANTKIVIPGESAAIADEGAQRVNASMALMQDAGQGERRRTWHDAGFPSENIVMGKPYGALTETLAVAPEGSVERTEAQLVSYPGMHAKATDVKHPDENGKIDMADNGLAFTVNSDMTASVFWKGDPTATPAHIDIPASVVIDDVTYPVTEIAPNAFKGAVFLTSITIPEGVVTINSSAFADCVNLAEPTLPTSIRQVASSAFSETTTTDTPQSAEAASSAASAEADASAGAEKSPEATDEQPVQTDETTTETDARLSSVESHEAITTYANSDRVTLGTGSTLTLTLDPAAVFDSEDFFVGELGYAPKFEIRRPSIVFQGNDSNTKWEYRNDGPNFLIFATQSNGNLGARNIYCQARFFAGSIAHNNATVDPLNFILTYNDAADPTGYIPWSALAGNGKEYTVARSDHNHDNSYAKKTELANYVTTTALNSKGYVTKTTADSTYAKKTDMPDLDGYVTKDAADAAYQPKGSYAASSHTHSQYATTTALNAKANSNLLSKSGETAFTSTSTVRGTTDALASRITTLEGKTHLTLGTTSTTAAAGNHTHSQYLTNTTAASTYATKTDVSALQTTVGNSTSGLVKKVADLEAKPHLTLGTTSTTAAAGNHTHSQYATTASLSNYVTKTTADSTYAKKTDMPDLDGYVTKDAADAAYQPKGSYAASSHTHSQYATTTALNAKANSNLLSKSGETAFTSTSTVRGTTDALASRITTLEGKTHLTLGTTSTTAAAGNHTHSQYLTNTTAASTYATKSSLSSYVTTTALNSKGYITQTDADSRYLLKDDVPSTEGYITKTEADAAYQPKGSYASSSHTHDSRYYTESEMDSKLLAKANANLLSKSGETAFSSTSTVRGTTDALSSRITTLEGKTHLTLGTTSTTAAAGNHTHSQYATTASLSNYVTNATASSTYAMKSSLSSYVTKTTADSTYAKKTDLPDLSSYVTTTALNSKGYITKTDADATYAKKSDIPTGGEAPDLSGYATQEWVEGKGYLTTTDGDKRYLLKGDVPSTEGYLTKDEADTAYQPKGDYAAKDHEHTQYAKTEALSNYVTNKTASDTYLSKTDAAKTYATVASLSGYVTTAALSGKLGDIGETTVAALLAGKVDASDFGTIRYVGLDAGDQNAYPTSYRKGSVPAVHAPVRTGYVFTGWTWKRGEATGTGELAQAFAEAGDVELTASWEAAPETPGGADAAAGKHFFSGGAPLTAGDAAEYQEHVVKVRLSSTPKAVSRVEFAPNDKTGLLKDASGVRFFVASTQDALASGTEVGWGASTQAGWSCQLAQLDDNSYGLYVGIRVPTSAIDASKVTTSYVDGSYVASLVKMNYTFA